MSDTSQFVTQVTPTALCFHESGSPIGETPFFQWNLRDYKNESPEKRRARIELWEGHWLPMLAGPHGHLLRGEVRDEE